MKRWTSALAVCVGLVVVASAWGRALTEHPELVRGRFDNGLSYMVMSHATPPERAALWMHVQSGSLNETEEQRGLAHFLEHLAFNGSEHFDKNEVVAFFESMGLTFGQHQNAFTSFDQTTYILELPDAETETLDKGLLFFSDVASRLSLDQQEIELERGVILEEMRTGLGPDQRIRDQIFERIAPGSLIGVRLPIGTEEHVTNVTRRNFDDYYGKWYVPSNITVAVVGDLPTADMVAAIERAFGGGEWTAPPRPQEAGVSPYQEMFAIVATDEELRDGSVSIIRIAAPEPPTTTSELYRDRLVERVAFSAFNRRMARKIREGELTSLGMQGFVGDMFNALRQIGVAASGDPKEWRVLLAELARELQRARLHGFIDQEIEDVRTEVRSAAERAVEREGTMPSSAVLGRINRSIGSGATFTSAADRLSLTEELLPTITAAEVNERFASLFDTSAVAFIASLPTDAEPPTESELLELGVLALDVRPEPELERARAAALLEAEPAPGEIVDHQWHAEAGVASVWMANGVRAHHRFMDEREDTAAISITLAGGPLLEVAETRGFAEAAALAFSRPASATLSSTQIEDLMVGRKVRVGGGQGQDTLRITVSGQPADLEEGMRLAHLLLTDALLEQAALDQWKERQRQMIEQRALTPFGVAQEAFARLIGPEGDARFQPLELTDLDRLEVEPVQAWLDERLAASPIEVAVVGDIEESEAMDLVARYVGSLPARDRIAVSTYERSRMVARPVGPLSADEVVETKTPQALVQVGAFGADWTQTRDRRLLNMAAQILSTRMIKSLREEQRLVYSIRAMSAPGQVFAGYGMLFAGAPTEPAKAQRLAEAIEGEFGRFAEEGPTDEEVATAKLQIANKLDEQDKEPAFWQQILSELTYRGTSLDEVTTAEEMYDSFAPGEVQGAVARHYTPSSMFRLIVRASDAEAEGG